MMPVLSTKVPEHSVASYGDVCYRKVFVVWGGVCCIRVFFVYGCLLFAGVCCIRVFFVYGCLLFAGVCCIRVFFVYGCLLFGGVFVVYGCFLYTDVCCLGGCLLYTGVFCIRMFVVCGCLLYEAPELLKRKHILKRFCSKLRKTLKFINGYNTSIRLLTVQYTGIIIGYNTERWPSDLPVIHSALKPPISTLSSVLRVMKRLEL